jgi:hypothetical protein
MPTKILNNFILVSMARRRNNREKRRSIINHRIADVHLCSQAGSFYRIFLCSCGGFSAFSRACEHNIPHIKFKPLCFQTSPDQSRLQVQFRSTIRNSWNSCK